MPESTDDYIHRIGRTGRVEKSGDAITLVTGADADKILALEKILNAPLKRLTLAGFDYTRPAPDKAPRPSYRPQRRVVRKREIVNQMTVK